MAPTSGTQGAREGNNSTAAPSSSPEHALTSSSMPSRPASIYYVSGGDMSASVAGFADTTSIANESFTEDKKPKSTKKPRNGITESNESGIAHADSRYARLNKVLLACTITAAVSSINYGWILGSINIPAQIIEQCSTGPQTWTNGFPSCIPMNSTLWGLVVGLTPLGAWAGSVFSGVCADRFGRKYTLMLNNIFFVIGAVLSGTATTIAQLAVGRFVSGIGCGVASNVVSIYNSEASTIKSRGFLGGFQQLMILVGLFFAQVASIGLSKAPLWRVLFSVSAAIAIVQTVLLYFIPESPKYLASKGKVDQAQVSLQTLRANLDITYEFDDLLAAVEAKQIDAMLPKPSLWQVLTGKTEHDLRHLIFCALFLMLSQQWSGVKGVLFYSTEILTSAFHLSKTQKETIPNIAQLLTLGIGGIGAVAVIIGMNIMDKVNRRTMLICSSCATSVCAAVIVIATKVDVGPLVATAMYMFNIVFQSGASFIPYLTASEIIPYYALGSISGLAAAANNLTLFVVSFVFPILDDALGPYLFVPFIITNFTTFLFCVFMMPEARGKPVSQVVEEYQGPVRIVNNPFRRKSHSDTTGTSVIYESHLSKSKKDFVAKALCPRILILASPSVENVCKVNNLDTFADLLAPFGQDVSTQITIQDGQGAPYFLDKICVKFTSNFSIGRQHQLEASEINTLLEKSIVGHTDSADLPFVSGATGVDKEAIGTGDISTWAPWYTLFRQQWINEMHASEHESFLHPVACVLVVSGSEADPVATLRELQRHQTANKVQTQSFSGPNTLFYYMLVHDERDTAILQTVDSKFDQVRRAFGQNCSLLRVNSNTDLLGTDSNDRSKVSSVWSSYHSATQPLDPPTERMFGTMMTMRDVAALRDSVKHLMVKSVIPHMQYMIRVLSEKTANQRRGITGRLFSAGRRYFGATTKTSSTMKGADGDIYFIYDSPEAMLRKLADYSFMLKDFKFAQSVYQVARRDFQSEKTWKCYAGAQEMVGISKLMMEIHATKAEFDSNFEDAISMYMYKTQTQQHFLAVRCIILYYELLKNHRLYAFAPGALLRVPESVASLFALMNEQAAYAYLKFDPRPEMRKFSFYAMVAAQAYQGAGIPDLAYRCLRAVHLTLGASVKDIRRGEEFDSATAEKQALSAPEKIEHTNDPASRIAALCSSWTAIDSHINHELGRQCMAVQHYDEAFMYFMALMGDDKVPPKLQAKYLQELLQLFLESSESQVDGDQANDSGSPKPPLVELSIPAIDPHQARIIMSPDLEGEDGLLTWTRSGSAPAQPDTAFNDSMAGRCCSVGESVAVLLVVSNPLTIGVTLNNFTLECKFDPAGEPPESELLSPKYEVSTVQSVILEGGQTAMVTVQIVPKCAGSLSILGANYLLCDILPTFKSLRIPGRRLNDTKEQRLSVTYAPETTLGFCIDPNLPHLEMALEEFPDALMSGSMCQVSLRVKNCGTLPCKSMALWLSHPSFFDIKSPHLTADDKVIQDPVYVYTETAVNVEKLHVPNVLSNLSTFTLIGQEAQELANDESSLHHIVPISQLDPESTCVVPLWLRGDRVGAHALKVCIGASTKLEPLCAGKTGLESNAKAAGQSSCSMRSRAFEVDLVVTPSLRVNAFMRPSITNPHERILGVDVENVRHDLHVELVQTTFSSGYYQLVPLSAQPPTTTGLSGESEETVVRIGPRQTINLVYRARPYKTPENGYKNSFDQSALPEMFTVNALRQFIYSSEKPIASPGSIDLIYSNHAFNTQGVDCIHSSLQGFIMRAQANKRRSMLCSNFPLIPAQHFPTLFPLFETFSVDFVLFWREIGGEGRLGHHSITGIDLGIPCDYANEALNPPAEGAARTWLADTAKERETLISSIANRPSALNRFERPLDVSMSVCPTKDAVGAGSPPYNVDVMISVYNHSWRYAYDFTLDLISPSQLDLSTLDGAHLEMTGSRASWSWIGETTYTLTVDPHGVAKISAKISCLSPGVIDTSLWHLSAKASSSITHDLSSSTQYRSKSYECDMYPHQPCFVTVGSSTAAM
ncbi:hypothetical protein EV179_001364 [Coemansia sp. RSA 487]|nr:hypothetical protein LPJ74_001768 [Coemansia sp. RSA 1843]KAJ2216339.1 hypothetical protein EV179_001364 [Coemansia sp. RSA 487]